MHLMDIAQTHPTLSTHDLRIINYCRLYLHVTTVSELLDAEGFRVLPSMMKCQRPPWFDPTMADQNQMDTLLQVYTTTAIITWAVAWDEFITTTPRKLCDDGAPLHHRFLVSRLLLEVLLA
jgi:hypothetical protein